MCVYDSLFFEACVCLVGWMAYSGGVAKVLWSLGSVYVVAYLSDQTHEPNNYSYRMYIVIDTHDKNKILS